MRKLLYIALSFLLLGSCAGQRRHDAALRRAQAILNDAPDSALTLLDSMEAFSSEFSRGTLMRWQLLRLSAQNKCDTVFRSDSLQLVLTNYFDRHGTPNERMMAHYLLGRAYSDMSQPLYAIRAFLDASAAVDTLSADCDWWNLTRVYMQLAQEYYDTYLPRELLSALEKAHNSSLRAGDTVTSIMSIGSKYDAYELLGMKDSASLVVRQAAMMYEAIGRHDLSSQVLSLLITPESEAGHVDTAASIIHYYEGFSGYFDSDHRIRRGMESYYYAKGIYYLHSDAPDSAEWMFRTLLEENTDLNGRHAAYLGLSKKYRMTGPKDSTLKYATLSEDFNDSLFRHHYNVNIQHAQHQYDYSIHQEEAHRLQHESAMKSRYLLIVVTVFVLAMSSLISIFVIWKRNKDLKMLKYKNDVDHLNTIRRELSFLVETKDKEMTDLSEVSNARKAEVERLQDEIRRLSSQFCMYPKDGSLANLENDFKCSPTVKEVWQCVESNERLTADTLRSLEELFMEKHPNFPAVLISAHRLSTAEYRVCELVWLRVPPSSISTLLCYERSNVSNMRKRMLMKVTGKSGKPKDFDDFLFSIPIHS